MRAIILSAGYGTRLWPLTEDRTKPAIPILGKPLVGYVAEYIAAYGFDDIVVNLHHRPESVRAALGDGSKFGVKLRYVEEPVILGTSGALDNTRDFFQDGTFLSINGKIITDIDLHAALETHRKTNALATLVLLENKRRERFSMVEVEEGRITGFRGMPDQNGSGPVPLMFTGIQLLEPRIFDYIPRGVFSHSVTDVYMPAIANGETIAAHIASGTWRELSTLKRYLDISVEMLKEQGQPYVAGLDCDLDRSAQISDAVLWDNVTVAAGAQIRRSVVADDVHVPNDATLENCVVVPRALVEGKTPPEKALKGQFQGENFIVPL
ncbi:MAG TPA: NDP-sugar synthase [Pyrinomonadaceae bacterium]|jgi:NDP-sugar pyrophosphorylase family protein|nr:NDP-sugar synthase [Pyrinomonadaceae bacterium]